MTTYVFDNAWRQARQRLAAIEEWLDPGTVHHLRERGVGPGWRCLEVGAGGGSVAAWLCDHVGPAGDVLDRPNPESRRHDITRDPLPTDAWGRRPAA